MTREMTEKHTPGPWVVQKLDTTFRIEANGIRVLATSWHQSIRDPYPLKDEAFANARLAAAAPDLLEALKLILEHCNNNVEVGTVGERVVERVEETALAAIAKAEVRS